MEGIAITAVVSMDGFLAGVSDLGWFPVRFRASGRISPRWYEGWASVGSGEVTLEGTISRRDLRRWVKVLPPLVIVCADIGPAWRRFVTWDVGR